MTFDPAYRSYEAIVRAFLDRHSTHVRTYSQYRTLAIAQDTEQLATLRRVFDGLPDDRRPIVVPPGGPDAHFWDAEDYHQKYRLRRNRAVTPLLEQRFGPHWDGTSLATKLNATGQPGLDLKPWLALLDEATERAFRRG